MDTEGGQKGGLHSLIAVPDHDGHCTHEQGSKKGHQGTEHGTYDTSEAQTRKWDSP